MPVTTGSHWSTLTAMQSFFNFTLSQEEDLLFITVAPLCFVLLPLQANKLHLQDEMRDLSYYI